MPTLKSDDAWFGAGLAVPMAALGPAAAEEDEGASEPSKAMRPSGTGTPPADDTDEREEVEGVDVWLDVRKDVEGAGTLFA
jgi:hypothetical protein